MVDNELMSKEWQEVTQNMESKLGFIYLCKENDVHALTVIHENSKLPNDNLYYSFFYVL